VSIALPTVESLRAHVAEVVLWVRKTEELAPVLDGVTAAMGRRRYPEKDVFAVRLALEEALVNAIKHGNGYDPSKVVRVRFQVLTDEVLAEVEDEGPGFDPADVADPCEPENLERSCGRGLLLMRHYLTWVRYDGRGNRVTLCKLRSDS